MITKEFIDYINAYACIRYVSHDDKKIVLESLGKDGWERDTMPATIEAVKAWLGY